MRALRHQKQPETHLDRQQVVTQNRSGTTIEELDDDWDLGHSDYFSPRDSDSSVILLKDLQVPDAFQGPKTSIVRNPTWSELSEPILADFMKTQSTSQALKIEDKVKIAHDSRCLVPRVSDQDLRKADELFTMKWKCSASEDRYSKVQSEDSDSDSIPFRVTIPVSRYKSIRSKISSPSDVFDMESVFEKVESMHSESLQSESSSRGKCNIPEHSEAANAEKISELEGLLENMWDQLETLTKKNTALSEEKKKMEESVTHFQSTIDQLVTEVVRLEDESEEKKTLLKYIWEESQVAQQAAKHRRKMLTSLRKDHGNVLTKLKLLQRQNKKKKSHMASRSEGSILPNMTNKLDLKTTIADFMGESPRSPPDAFWSSYEEKQKHLRAVNGAVVKEERVILKPQSDVDDMLTKLAQVDFSEEKLFRVTIEEISPTKNNVTSFEILEQDADISELMAAVRKICPHQQNDESSGNMFTPPNEAAGYGEKVELSPSKLFYNRLSSSVPPGGRNCRLVRSRSSARSKPTHFKGRRSWSAPPNRSVCMTLLRSLERLTKPKTMDTRERRLSARIKKDAFTVIRRLSLKEPSNETNIGAEVDESLQITLESADSSLMKSPDRISNNQDSSKWRIQTQSSISFESHDWKMQKINRHYKVKKIRRKRSKKRVARGRVMYEAQRCAAFSLSPSHRTIALSPEL